MTREKAPRRRDHRMTAEKINDLWYVIESGRIVAGPFVHNAEAWREIDRRAGASESMPSRSITAPCGVKDRIAAAMRQVELALKIAIFKAIQDAMPEIEAVIRETYLDSDQEEIPD